MALSEKAFQNVVVAALVATLIGILYDTFRPYQGAMGAMGAIRRKVLPLGLRKPHVNFMRAGLGAARSPAHMNLGVASLQSGYSGSYNPDAPAKPDVPDVRQGAPVYWGPYEDDMQSIGDAYGAAYNAAAPGPQPPTAEEMRQGGASALLPSVEQRAPQNDLLRGNP